MIQQVLSHYHLPVLAIAGLLIFMGVFFGAVAWVYRKGSDGIYRSISELPLREE